MRRGILEAASLARLTALRGAPYAAPAICAWRCQPTLRSVERLLRRLSRRIHGLPAAGAAIPGPRAPARPVHGPGPDPGPPVRLRHTGRGARDAARRGHRAAPAAP